MTQEQISKPKKKKDAKGNRTHSTAMLSSFDSSFCHPVTILRRGDSERQCMSELVQ
jgi:hypothetical protein